MYPSSFTEGNKILRNLVFSIDKELENSEQQIFRCFETYQKYYQQSKENFENKVNALSAFHEKSEIRKADLRARIEIIEKIILTQQESLKIKEETIATPLYENNKLIEMINEQTLMAKNLYSDLSNFLEFFEKGLGLEICKINNNVEFKFNYISQGTKNDHIIMISIVNNNYVLVKCIPYLEKIELLIGDLNITNDLSKFIKRVRSQFKLLYN